eukprot:gene14489-biopygen21645
MPAPRPRHCPVTPGPQAGIKIHQNLEFSNFLGVPPGCHIRPPWGANGPEYWFFGVQMTTLCVQTTPASPGAQVELMIPGGLEMSGGWQGWGVQQARAGHQNPPKSRNFQLSGGATRVPYPIPMGCQRA